MYFHLLSWIFHVGRLEGQNPATRKESIFKRAGSQQILIQWVCSRVLRDSTTRFVGPSVRPSVHWSVGPSVTLYFFWVFAVFGLTAPAQMME